ncbi:MAG: tRNA pseudouridine(55) synthase TruB [Terriglobia bacterium]
MDHPASHENGFLVIDKPEGLTSHQVVDKVRQRLELRRVGHLGTLDPLATGVLPIAVGKATRLIQFLKNSRKVYQGTIHLGITTETYDREGQILAEHQVPPLTMEQLHSLALEFQGPRMQVPPQFSAKKIKGVPAYRLARRGKPVEIPPQEIVIHHLELSMQSDHELIFHMECSAGTYVRSFASDFGKRLGCGAHLSRLRRISSGDFSLAQAISLEVLMAAERAPLIQRLIPAGEVMKCVPGLQVDQKTKESLAHGRPFIWAWPSDRSAPPENLCVYFEGELIGLVEPISPLEEGESPAVPVHKFQPRVVLL